MDLRSCLLPLALALSAASSLTLLGPAAPARAAELAWPTADPVAASSVSDQACADLLFVGVRGSGEPAPYGDTVTSVHDALAAHSPQLRSDRDLQVREVYIDYPAVSPETLGSVGIDGLLFSEEMPPTAFFDSITEGTGSTLEVLTDSATRCPGERWVLAGFSQGAQVVSEALANSEISATTDERLLGAITVGNPANAPMFADAHRFGDAPEGSVGLSTSLYYLRQRIADARQDADPVGIYGALRSVVELSGDNGLDRQLTVQVLTANGLQPPARLSDRITGVCRAGDLICDAGPGLSAMVFEQAPLQDEVDRAEPIHLGYADLADEVVVPTLDQLASWQPPAAEQSPVDRFLPGVAAGVAGSLALVTVGTLIGRARRRNDRSPRSES